MKTYDSPIDLKLPVTTKGVEAFLAGGYVAGIGPVFARRLVEQFGTEAVDVLLNDPERAAEVPGLGAARIAEAAESLRTSKHSVDVALFLASSGVSDMFVDRIFGKYGRHVPEILARDPYEMVEDVWQLSFFTADKIGKALGIAPDDPRRLRGALVTAVKHFAEDGHLFATPEQAVAHAAATASVEPAKVEAALDGVVADGRLVRSRGGLYLPVFYRAEKEGAEKIRALTAVKMPPADEAEIPEFSHGAKHYSDVQRKAIMQTLASPVIVLTGGPGSGKTTVLSGVMEALRNRGKKVVAVAPTGRAAKRLSTLTGSEASTIHRLLGYRQGEGYNKRAIDADALIVDEGSMMEQVLFNHLLDAVRPGTQVIMVGDPVMQTANSSERGVYNGETGRITGVDEEAQTLEVTFSDGRQSTYHRTELTELVLAYATTVHKLQGSETRYMIFPVTMAHKPMLYRNLLYTAVSRATELCVLVGEPEALRYAVDNNPSATRNSNFAQRLNAK